LHRLSSGWHEGNGFLEKAIDHALAARDWEKAMKIISIPEVNARNVRTETMYNWLRFIPEEVLRTDTEICMNYIWALEWMGRYDIAERFINYIEETHPGDTRLQGRLAGVRTTIAVDKGDFPHVEEYARRALSLLPVEDADQRGIVCLQLGMSYMLRNLNNEAEPLLTESYELLRETPIASNAAYPLAFLGTIAFARGNLQEAERILKEVTGKPENNVGGRAVAHAYLGLVYFFRNDLEEALVQEERAVELTKLSMGRMMDVAYLYLSGIRLARGDIEGAAQALEKTDRVLEERRASPMDLARRAGYHVELALAREAPDSVSMWLDKLAQYEHLFPITDIPAAATRLLLARKSHADAAAILQAVYQQFSQQGLYVVTTSVRVTQALMAGTPDEAMAYLSEALARGKAMGLVRNFVNEGMPLAPLLRKAISMGIEPEYALKLLDIIIAEDRQRKIRKGELPASTIDSGLLSEREIEVLRLVADGLNNQQIAEKLVISLSTAKSHVYHIFDKLNARDRLQAVTRARELKLL